MSATRINATSNGIPPMREWATATSLTSRIYQQAFDAVCANGLPSRRAFAEVAHPRGIQILDGGQQPPVLPLGRQRRRSQSPAEIRQQMVGLTDEAPTPHRVEQPNSRCS